jgi:5-methylcytosine-specific restriction endonuclease McrA
MAIMPMKQSLYPPDWPEIALREKERAQFMCEKCGADCLEPTTQANRMSVHHLDHDPSNCDPDNLLALCAVCHLRMDAMHHARNAAITRAIKRAGPTIPMPLLYTAILL